MEKRNIFLVYDMEALRSFLKGTLSRRSWTGHRIEKLAQQLFFIGKGLKTGFVWDIGLMQAETANDLLDKLKEAKLVQQSLILFKIGDDFGIVDATAIGSLKFEHFCFINISKCLSSPKVVSESCKESSMIQNMFDEVCQQIKLTRTGQIWTIQLDPSSACFPTVFGILIGYPIVYWYDVAESDENCLAGLPLEVFQVGLPSGGMSDDDVVPTISFSIPSCVILDGSVEGRLQAWNKTVTDCGFKFIHFVKCLDSVVL